MIREIALILLLATPAAAQTVVPPLNAAQTKASTRANLVGKLADLTAQANAVSASLQANRVTATDDAAAADAATMIDLRSQIYDVQCSIATLDGASCAAPPPYYRKTTKLNNAIRAQSDNSPIMEFRFAATLTVAPALSLVGKKTVTVSVPGLLANDAVVVTPRATVPTTLTLGDFRPSADGTLELSVTFPQLVTLSAAVTIPLDILAYR